MISPFPPRSFWGWRQSWRRHCRSLEAKGAGGARDEGRPLSRSIAPRKPAFRQTRRSVGLIRPAKFARISPSPSQVTTPRLIGPKEGGHQEAGLSKGWRGPLPIRGTDGAISAEGAVAAWGRGCRAPGRRRMEGMLLDDSFLSWSKNRFAVQLSGRLKIIW
jgi:hypothetical protein